MKKSIKFSVLDLVPVHSGETAGDAIRAASKTAQAAEQLGFFRYLIAEHHNTFLLASAATSVVVQYILAHTDTIRVGAGGVMLPKHILMKVAETYAAIDSLFPGRVDLGLGRAPGTDPLTARLIARRQYMSNEAFFDDVIQLMSYFDAAEAPGIKVYPKPQSNVCPIILGSSTHSAYVAAAAGLPYAFAVHLSPGQAAEAISTYRDRFHPSQRFREPYVLISLWNFAASTTKASEERYNRLLSFLAESMAGINENPEDSSTPRPLTSSEKILLSARFGGTLSGAPQELLASMKQWVELADPDEIILATLSDSVEETAESLRIAKDTLCIL